MYTEKILTKMDMDNCKPVKTPVDPGNRLVKATERTFWINNHINRSLEALCI